MRIITLPVIDRGMVTLLLNECNNLAVIDGPNYSSYDKSMPKTCYLMPEGSTGGYHIAMSRIELVKELRETFA